MPWFVWVGVRWMAVRVGWPAIRWLFRRVLVPAARKAWKWVAPRIAKLWKSAWEKTRKFWDKFGRRFWRWVRSFMGLAKALPNFEEEIVVIVHGTRNSTKRRLHQLALSLAFGAAPERGTVFATGYPTAGVVASEYDRAGKIVQVTLRYQYNPLNSITGVTNGIAAFVAGPDESVVGGSWQWWLAAAGAFGFVGLPPLPEVNHTILAQRTTAPVAVVVPGAPALAGDAVNPTPTRPPGDATPQIVVGGTSVLVMVAQALTPPCGLMPDPPQTGFTTPQAVNDDPNYAAPGTPGTGTNYLPPRSG